MIAWALGRIGTREATVALKNFYAVADGIVKDEITQAMISTGEKR